MRVLVAAVTRGTTMGCSLGFTVSMMRLQVALLSAPNMQVEVNIVSSLKKAIELAAADDKFDAVVAIGSNVAFPAAFVLRALVAPSSFVAGIYPLPSIDWDRITARVTAKGSDAEEMRFKGNTYNIDPSTAKQAGAAGYLSVTSAGLDAVVLKKEAFTALAASKTARDDDELCRAWGKDILADLDNQCSTMGPVEFTGCVGLRTVLR